MIESGSRSRSRTLCVKRVRVFARVNTEENRRGHRPGSSGHLMLHNPWRLPRCASRLATYIDKRIRHAYTSRTVMAITGPAPDSVRHSRVDSTSPHDCQAPCRCFGASDSKSVRPRGVHPPSGVWQHDATHHERHGTTIEDCQPRPSGRRSH